MYVCVQLTQVCLCSVNSGLFVFSLLRSVRVQLTQVCLCSVNSGMFVFS